MHSIPRCEIVRKVKTSIFSPVFTRMQFESIWNEYGSVFRNSLLVNIQICYVRVFFHNFGCSWAVSDFYAFETLVSVVLGGLESVLVLLDGELLRRSIQGGDSQRFSFRYGFLCLIWSFVAWDLLEVDDPVVFSWIYRIYELYYGT